MMMVVNYENVTLNAGDQIVITYKRQYPANGAIGNLKLWLNNSSVYCTDLNAVEKTTYTYTASSAITLTNIQFGADTNANAIFGYYIFDVYSIELVEKVNVAGTTLATPTYFKEANEVSVPLDAATYTIYAKDNGEYFNYESTASIGSATSLLKITYNDLVLNAGDKIVLTLKMYNSSTVNFNLNGGYVDWFSDSTAMVVTKEITINAQTTLSTLEFTAGKNAQVHIFDVYGIEIVRA
jgi:hypothetical protein